MSTLLDSGNLAREPISGRMVAFASLEKCRVILDEELYWALKRKTPLEELPTSIALGVRLISARTVGGHSLLPAIRYKNAELVCEKRRINIDIYVAFCDDESLSGFDAIISDEIMN